MDGATAMQWQRQGWSAAATQGAIGSNDGNAMTRRQRNGNCDGQQWTVQRLRDGDNKNGARRQWRRHPNERRPPLWHARALRPGVRAPRAVVLPVQVHPPPYRLRDRFTYAHPLMPLDVCDLGRAPGHVSKFNCLLYLVRWSLLNSPGGRANDDRRRDCDGNCNNNDVYSDNGGGTTMTKAKEDGEGHSPMRRRVEDIADKIIKALVESIDEGGHSPVSPLTPTVSVRSKYGRHRLLVLVEHLAVVLRARLRRNNSSRFNDNTSTNGIVQQPVSMGTRHRDMDTRHQDKEAFGEDLRQESRKAEKARTRQMRSVDLLLAPKHRPMHHSMARCRGRWCCRRCCHQPAIAFPACARRGGKTVALASNPPVAPPIAGPQHHLPPH